MGLWGGETNNTPKPTLRSVTAVAEQPCALSRRGLAKSVSSTLKYLSESVYQFSRLRHVEGFVDCDST